MPSGLPRRLASAAAALALLASGCGAADPPAEPEGDLVPLPEGAAIGDEIVAAVKLADVSGSFLDEEDPGFLLELKLGANIARHVIAPGGSSPEIRVSLGAWDGGELRALPRAGSAATTITAAVDPAAAGVPVMGLYDDRFWNDVPLGVYAEGDLYTYILTNEDGGTGLFPTLLMAQYGRPVDIEGLYRGGASPEIQADGHAWTPFEGPYEGTHPLLQIVTLNGLVGPDAGSFFRVSSMPIPFTTEGAPVPREQVLDLAPWILEASFAEVERQGEVIADGGPKDGAIGAPDDYVFIDYEFDSAGAVASFEAQVEGAWWSSLGPWTSLGGLTDAHASGVGRTCVELPPGASPEDVTALKIVSAGSGAGTLKSARWFRYGEGLAPIEMGKLTSAVSIGEGAAAEALIFGP